MKSVRGSSSAVILALLLGVQAAAAAQIAIEPYPAKVNDATGEVEVWGQRIVHRDFDVQLEDKIVQVPIFTIQYEGRHHIKLPGKRAFEARAKCIAERLAIAWDLLGQGGSLVIQTDDWNEWRRVPGGDPPPAPAIYVAAPQLGGLALRIMTIYKQDVEAFPRVSTQKGLAEYIIAMIRAHYLLFAEKSADIQRYEELRVDKTREGKIFKEIFIRAREVMELKNLDKISTAILKDALARVAESQRQRLVNMAYLAPIDWK